MHVQVLHMDRRFRVKDILETTNKCAIFQEVDLLQCSNTILVKASGHSGHHNPLQCECVVLNQLHDIKGIPNIPWSGTEGELDVIIFEDLSPTLEDVFKSTGKNLLVNSVSLLVEHLILCLEYIYSHSYIYSNIRPKNIFVGLAVPGQQANELFLFDFTLVQLYKDPQTYTPVLFHSIHPPTGAATSKGFSSINYHLGNQLSHWDDFESLTVTP
ncbi:hypothetical protein PAXRUDRAFT_148631 [Paxillus rubicundulus Ve08.2h10]|uniref:Protein kinase domain-containing protein n=1 Tax=Paxillus rubicundulus Ve08.2h10 TaxID=930991 RepID=A0A0D0DYP5_9AGAM|nr:hypothetical protein PAXRUDRAFT_148631 [Paxillus rubicundulus Ve08.2h10]